MKMRAVKTKDPPASQERERALPDIPIEHLTLSVYESAPPSVREKILTQLVAKVFEASPPPERSLIIHRLLRPMGVLALATVANGAFAKYQFSGENGEWQGRIEDAMNVRTSDIIALVERAQQISNNAVNGLIEVISKSPVLASSAAASILMMALVQYSQNRRSTDFTRQANSSSALFESARQSPGASGGSGWIG
jgi:hypothetical protein